MITVERKRRVAARAERVRELIADVEQLPRLIPRVERVEVLARNQNRAHLALWARIGRLGRQRIEGEARLVDDGLRFIAVQPMQIDARWSVVARDDEAEVAVRLLTEVPRGLAMMSRLIPQRMIDDRIGQELEHALDALERLARDGDATEQG